MNTSKNPPALDNPESAGYMRNLIQALKLHSPDSMWSAVGYLHLTGLHLPLLAALAAYNDAIIEHGTGADVARLESLLSSTVKYVERRLALVEGRQTPGNALERHIGDKALDSSKRLASEYLLGSVISLKIALEKDVRSLAPEMEAIVTWLLEEQIANSILTDTAGFEQTLTQLREEIHLHNFLLAAITLKKLLPIS
jgi:hypothetical protein